MSREEAINKLESLKISLPAAKSEISEIIKLIETPWIKYKDKRPEFGIEVIAFHHKWIDEDFNPNGTRVGFINGDDTFTSAFWWDYQDCYTEINAEKCEEHPDFYRSHIDNTEPEYWKPMPKAPIEIE